ncbi:MAG: DEAD/DEAH box helicase [Pseudomonadota bacterium]
MSFSELGLSAELLRAIDEQGYTQPTPVQTQAIPVIMAGRDILAGAQTGTGKTAGFTLPLLQRLTASTQPGQTKRVPRALILTPTRELAAQVAESVATYGKYLALKSAVIFGGVGIHPQIDALRRGVDIVVATPGRLLDHVGQKTVDLSKIEILVLDEADRMLDMGFIHDIRKILALLPRGRQNLLFSATYSDEIKQLADKLLNNPALVEVARRNIDAEGVTQVVHRVDRERKRELLSHLISTNDWRQVLVFTRTKHGANRLAEQLDKDGITAAAIHGNKSQGARTRALADFKAGKVRVLVATDIAARGLDIDQLPHVVNFELPNVAEDYVHRIGRTGRAGASGEAVSLICADELDLLAGIQRLIKRELPLVNVPGFEHDPSIRAEPIPNGRNSARGARNTPRAPRGDQPRREHAPRRDQARGEQPRRDAAPRRDAGRGEQVHRERVPRDQPRREQTARPPRADGRPVERSPGNQRSGQQARREEAPRGEANGNVQHPAPRRDHAEHNAAPQRPRGVQQGQRRDNDSHGNHVPPQRQDGPSGNRAAPAHPQRRPAQREVPALFGRRDVERDGNAS